MRARCRPVAAKPFLREGKEGRVRSLPLLAWALLAVALVAPAAAASGQASGLTLYFSDGGLRKCGDGALLLDPPKAGAVCQRGPALAVAGAQDDTSTFFNTDDEELPGLDSGAAATVILHVGGQLTDNPRPLLRVTVDVTARRERNTTHLGSATVDCATGATTETHCDVPLSFTPFRLWNDTSIVVNVTFDQDVGAFSPAIRTGGDDPSRIEFPQAIPVQPPALPSPTPQAKAAPGLPGGAALAVAFAFAGARRRFM